MKKTDCLNCREKGCCPCPECKEKQSPPCQVLENRYGLKKWCVVIILFVATIGCLGPFVAQCVLPFFFPECTIDGLEIWNQYVGIVLGIVATILSIVSLIMGFNSANEASEQQRKAFDQYEATIELIHKVETDVADVGAKVGKNPDSEHIKQVKTLQSEESKIEANDIE